MPLSELLTEEPPVEVERYLLTVFVAGHSYQPPREFWRLFTDQRADILSGVNEQIFQQCYFPLFDMPALPESDRLPEGTVFSLYGTLREWWKVKHPESFEHVRQKITAMPDREYRIMADSYLHPIMPFQSRENKDMLVKIGKQAFFQDFGFEPKGFWPPETAIDQETLEVLHTNGYEFVVLGDHQLQYNDGNNPQFVELAQHGEKIGDMAIIHFDSGLSGPYSHNGDMTIRAEDFLAMEQYRGRSIAIASDTEFYGHHQPFKDQFLYRVMQRDVLANSGRKPLDVKAAVTTPREQRHYTKIWENSSWSCPHNFGRWTGDASCNCDGVYTDDAIQYKQYLRGVLQQQGQEIDARLDALSPQWREQFIPFFLAVRQSMYVQGDINEDIQRLKEDGMSILEDQTAVTLFKANLARWTGETSCAWFFGGSDRPEREITRINIEEINALLGQVKALDPKPSSAHLLFAA